MGFVRPGLFYPIALGAGAVGGGAPIPRPPGGGVGAAANWSELREELQTRKWSWIPRIAGGIGGNHNRTWKPYSWSARHKQVEKIKITALTDVAEHGGPANDDVRKVFKRVHELQSASSRAKNLEDCRADLSRINAEIAHVEDQRKEYVANNLVMRERLPKLTPAGRAALFRAQLQKDIARVISNRYELASRAGTAGAAKNAFDTAVNHIAAKYGFSVVAVAGGGYTYQLPGRLPGAGRLDDSPQMVWQAIQNYHRITNAARAAAALAVGVPPAGQAQAVANAVHRRAIDDAKALETDLMDLVVFVSPTLNGYAQEIQRLKKELQTVGDHVIESLCNAKNGHVYDDMTSFDAYYRNVIDTYNEAAGESMNRLNKMNAEIGLPSLADERRELSTRRQIREQLREATSKWPLIISLTALEGLIFVAGGVPYAAPLGVLTGMGVINTAITTLVADSDYD